VIDQQMQVHVVGHPGLVEDHHILWTERDRFEAQPAEQRRHGVGLDAAVLAHGAGSLPRSGGDEDASPVELARLPDGAQRGGLTGSGDADDHIHTPTRRTHPTDGSTWGLGRLHAFGAFGVAESAVHDGGRDHGSGVELVTMPGLRRDGSFGVDHTPRRRHRVPARDVRFELDRGGVAEDPVDQILEHGPVKAKHVRGGDHDHVPA
jgi:hypothetical protein